MPPASARKKAKESTFNVPSGWNTSDEDEINRRRQRAQSEAMQVEQVGHGLEFFGDYRVRAGSSNHYQVEIRLLAERLNSCTCADYDTNGLGTCKHVEKVLLSLRKKGVRKFREASRVGSCRTEVHVHPGDGSVRIMQPDALPVEARNLFRDFFSADGSLMGEPATVIPAIKRAVREAPENISRHIRISHRLDTLLARGENLPRRQKAKEYFLHDVRDGKRSLDIMKLPLYPYQQDGMLHLAFAQRAILADEMGLGKTVQAIAACELLRRLHGIRRVLVVATTSLKSEWEEQIAKFSHLSSIVITGNRAERLRQYRQDAFFIITNYEQIRSDLKEIQDGIAPDVVILDEAQRIKNWRTRTAAIIKSLKSRYAFVLTGTPVENRIEDIYSLVQFIDPHFFGPLFRFNREFYHLDDKGRPKGYKNLDVLHRRLKPLMLRRRKSDVEGELPDRTINNYFVPMSEEQRLRYGGYEAEVAKLAAIARRRALLEPEFLKLQKSLAAMRMLCDTPYILDEECRICPKLEELEKLLEELCENPDTKIIIFSEWERMLMLVREHLKEKNIGFAWHTGSVEQKKRRMEINHFKNDASCRVFLSTDAGSVGLNLQVASVVINLDIPWNPAKLEQRIARAWRKHQTRSVQVINMVSENSIEHRMLGLLKQKQALADTILETGEDGEMNLPSGRASMMERLDTVLGQSPAPHPANAVPASKKALETAPIERFQEEAVARFSQRMERLEAYGNTVLAVIEGDGTEPKKRMQEMLAAADPDASLTLETLDKATYETIIRLCKAGILSFNGQPSVLHQAHVAFDSGREERRRRSVQARTYLDQAYRKQRMAELLVGGGFSEEAYMPLTEGFEAALKAFVVFAGHAVEENVPIAIALLEKEAARKTLPENTVTLATGLREKPVPDTQAAKKLLQPVQELIGQVDEHVNKAIELETIVFVT